MEPPYNKLFEAQRETWDSVPKEDVHTLYYHGGASENQYDLLQQNHKSHSGIIQTADTNAYYYMASKFQTALKFALLSQPDIIFRTNSSSYVNKQKLKEFAATLPKEKLYAGWTMVDSEDHGGLVVSGAGIFLSKDTAKILIENIDPQFEQEEDIYCGRILRKHGIVATDDKNRYDVPSQFSEIPLDRYHYRFKTGDRIQDAKNMVELHKRIIQ